MKVSFVSLPVFLVALAWPCAASHAKGAADKPPDVMTVGGVTMAVKARLPAPVTAAATLATPAPAGAALPLDPAQQAKLATISTAPVPVPATAVPGKRPDTFLSLPPAPGSTAPTHDELAQAKARARGPGHGISDVLGGIPRPSWTAPVKHAAGATPVAPAPAKTADFATTGPRDPAAPAPSKQKEAPRPAPEVRP